MDSTIEESWKNALKGEFDKTYFTNLLGFVNQEYKVQTIYPPENEIFKAFDHCPFTKVEVVIIGQDPYHGPNQANGLCFSVRDGIRQPPSLQNIFKEIEADLGIEPPASGNLERWADQGVLLLNATLTVRSETPGSHQNRGWEEFTDAVIREVSTQKTGLVFILWGAYAQKKGEFIDVEKHLVLKSAHPSPFAARKGFFGNKHFSQTNAYLLKKGKRIINW